MAAHLKASNYFIIKWFKLVLNVPGMMMWIKQPAQFIRYQVRVTQRFRPKLTYEATTCQSVRFPLM